MTKEYLSGFVRPCIGRLMSTRFKSVLETVIRLGMETMKIHASTFKYLSYRVGRFLDSGTRRPGCDYPLTPHNFRHSTSYDY